MSHHRVNTHQVRPNTVAVIGIALGDEGKGRIVDNLISTILKKKHIRQVYVVRYQGGSNAGHSIEYQGKRLALHQVPSGVFHEQVIGIMDRGMVIHPEDLKVEVGYIEKAVGDISGKLIVSEEAVLVTDLERAEEVLNRKKQGKAKGGTGRGIGPAYAHHYDRLGLHIHNLMDDTWKEALSSHYERYMKEFLAFDEDISNMMVPDFLSSQTSQHPVEKKIGTKKAFIDRMGEIRSWLLKRNMVSNIVPLHHRIFYDLSIGVLFEGAQAVGLHPWFGTIPDTTASNTTAYGVAEGTGYWRREHIDQVVGVCKITYTSSVGARKMPTEVVIPKDATLPLPHPTKAQEWATYVITEAHEYGTTTKRRRDILYLDLPMLAYNCAMGGVTHIAGTHIDIARKTDEIKVCIGYKDQQGNDVLYQPGLRYQEGIIPQYTSCPGWDGNALARSKTRKDFPKETLTFLQHIEQYLGCPISCVTTGPKREQIVEMV